MGAYAPSFMTVGTSEVNLADITVNSDSYISAGNVVLQILNDDGTTKTSYYWIYNATHGGTSGTAGWYKAKTGKPADLVTKESNITFKPGEGFWLKGSGKQIQSQGEVLLNADVVVNTLALGMQMVANPFPVDVKLADMIVESDSYISAGNVVAQILNDDGTTNTSYYWIYNATHGGTSGTAGWYKAKTGKPADLVTKEDDIGLKPGEAYWVKGSGKNIRIQALSL